MLKVLVVDDEAPIRRWLEYCIDQFDGFTVAGVAASGTEGLEIYGVNGRISWCLILRCLEWTAWRCCAGCRRSIRIYDHPHQP